MLDLTNRTMTALLQEMLLRVTEEVNKRDGSLIKTALSACAWVIEGLYIELIDVQQQAYGTTATGGFLDLKAAERGVYRLPAVASVYQMQADLNTIAQGTEFADSSNYTWAISSDVLSGPDSEGLYTYTITCQTAGEIPTPSGDLRPLSFIAGLQVARFGSEVVPGRAIESDSSLRERYEESLVEIAFAGNIAAYREKILELTYDIGGSNERVGALQVFPTTDANGVRSGGHVKIYILSEDLTEASQELIDAVQTAICPMYNGVAVGDGYGWAPIGASVHIASVTTTPTLEIDVTVLLVQGYALSSVVPQIEANIKKYISEQKAGWTTQIAQGIDTAKVIIREAFIYAASLIEGVADVTDVVIKKGGVVSVGSASWNTTGVSMEWIDDETTVINITE